EIVTESSSIGLVAVLFLIYSALSILSESRRNCSLAFIASLISAFTLSIKLISAPSVSYFPCAVVESYHCDFLKIGKVLGDHQLILIPLCTFHPCTETYP